MELKEEIKLSIQTLELAGVHYLANIEKVKSILLHLFGRRNLASFFVLNDDASLHDVMAKLQNYLESDKWRLK